MKDKQFLMIPGPTPVPESALQAMAKHPLGHRSKEFSAILKQVFQDLKWLFQTQEDVFIYTSSGTGAMEAAIYNLVNPGDKVLSLVIGNFGERWAKIAESRGANVEKLSVDWGCAINPQDLKEKLASDKNKEIKFVTLTHNETSTGVTNDLKALNDIIQEHGALSIVDGITSIGALPFNMDEWGIDVIVSGSQKGFMIPPGLAFLACSQKAWKVYEQCKYPSFYFDFAAYKKNTQKDTTPYTPAVSLIAALSETLKMMKEEGLDNIHKRHAKIASGLRAAVEAIGLELFVKDERVRSDVIVAIQPPADISVADIRKGLKDDFDIVVADGQGELKGKIFRIGNLGFVCERDMLATIGALEIVLARLGHNIDKGKATAAFIEAVIDN